MKTRKRSIETVTPSVDRFNRKIAQYSIWSILVSGNTTVFNLSILLILKGEHGIECLLCCSIDVLVNTLALAIITDSRGEAFSFPELYGLKEGHKTEIPLTQTHYVQVTPAASRDQHTEEGKLEA